MLIIYWQRVQELKACIRDQINAAVDLCAVNPVCAQNVLKSLDSAIWLAARTGVEPVEGYWLIQF